jgi:hypothetical protein
VLAASILVKRPHPIRRAPIDSLNVIHKARTTGMGKPILAINGANPMADKDFPA